MSEEESFMEKLKNCLISNSLQWNGCIARFDVLSCE